MCGSAGDETRFRCRGGITDVAAARVPKSAVRAVPSRLLLLCLRLGSSWLTVEGGSHGAAGVPHRRGGRAALAGSVNVGWWRSNSQLSSPRRQTSEFSGGCGGLAPPARWLVLVRCESAASRLQVARNARGCGSLTVQLKLANDGGRRVNLASVQLGESDPFPARSARPAHRGRSLGRVRPRRRSPVAVGSGPSATRRHAPRSRNRADRR